MPNIGPEAGSIPSAKRLHVAVGVIRQGDRVLIARRPDGKHQGGLLEFPGGKVEAGESVPVALARELAEEVALAADPVHMVPLIQVHHVYVDKHGGADKQVLLDVWTVSVFSGVPRGLEGQPVQWLAIDALRDADFPAANRAIIRALQLPAEWLITPADVHPAELVRHLEAYLARRNTGVGVLLRQPQLSRADYRALARDVLPLCRERHLPLVLHGHPRCLEDVPEADGVHLPQAAASALSQPILPESKWLGISCHSAVEITTARRLGADYAFLSPIRPTASHPDRAAIGWDQFSRWAALSVAPVYALGGMTADDIHQSRLSGGQGIAGIGHWWRNRRS